MESAFCGVGFMPPDGEVNSPLREAKLTLSMEQREPSPRPPESNIEGWNSILGRR